MSFWARASISVGLILFGGFVWGQGVGRFRSAEVPVMPGFIFSKEGIRSRFAGSDTLFYPKSIDYKLTSSNRMKASYSGPIQANCAQGLVANLLSPGVEAYFPNSAKFRITSVRRPILTVADASYGPETPTPDSSWILLTFGDQQPPILFSFLGRKASLVVNGKSGEWELQTSKPFVGWIRISLPFGTQGISANGATALGQLAKTLSHQATLWTQPAPQLVSRKVERTEKSVLVRMQFDRASCLVPPAIILSKLGGYKVKIYSPISELNSWNEEGPVVVTKTKNLVFECPLLSVPAGRPQTIGKPEIGKESSKGLAQTCQLGLLLTTSWRPNEALEKGRSLLAQDKSEHPSFDSIAADSLLWRGLSWNNPKGVSQVNERLNALLTELDPSTLRFMGTDLNVARRASGIAAIAAAFDSKPEINLIGSLLQMGMRAEAVLPSFCAAKGIASPPTSKLEPFKRLRNALYLQGPIDSFLATFSSPMKTGSAFTFVVKKTEDGLVMTWDHQKGDVPRLLFRAPWKLEFEPVSNLKDMTENEEEGENTVDYVPEKAGQCSVRIRPKTDKFVIPNSVAPPSYSE